MQYRVIYIPILLYAASLAHAQLVPGAVFTGQYQDPLLPSDDAFLRVVEADGTLFSYPILEGQIGTRIPSPGFISAPMVYAGDACSPFDPSIAAQGSIVLAVRGTCPFITKAFNAQQAGAVAVIIFNNQGDFLVTMASDGSHTVTIPAAFTYETFGRRIENYLNGSIPHASVEAVLAYATFNSLRVSINTVSGPNVSATVEYRVTAGAADEVEAHLTPYAKYTVTGTLAGQALTLRTPYPANWIVEPTMDGDGEKAFGLVGSFDPAFTRFSGSEMPPFSSSFNLRRTDNVCGSEVRLVERCASQSSFCGKACLMASDVQGYRIFNDNACEFAYPLLWHCDDDTCEGEYLVLQAHENSCVPGQTHNHPYYTFWPEGEPVSYFSAFQTTCEPAQQCAATGNTGWRMRGSYIDSGPSAGDGTNSTLVYAVTTKTPGSISFSYTSEGEVFYDYLRFEWNDQPVELFTKFQIVENWKVATFNLPIVGAHVFKWKWTKDDVFSSGPDMAKIKQIVVTGTANSETCIDCPEGYCSSGGLAGCKACPQGTYSSAAAPTCSACANAKPFNSHYTNYAETTSTCAFNCDSAYVKQGDSCAPVANWCYMPPFSMEGNKFDPPSMAMLNNCLNMLPLQTSSAQKTLNVLSDALDMYVFAGDNTAVKTKLMGIAGKVTMGDFPNDQSFHESAVQAVGLANDGNLVYTPPQLYSDITLYLPWSFSSSSSNGVTKIYVSGLNNAAATYGYRHDGVPNAASYQGWILSAVDTIDAIEAVKIFAEEQVFISSDPNIRFNAALRSRYSTWGTSSSDEGDTGSWSCSFAIRNLGQCALPTNPTVTVVLTNPACAGGVDCIETLNVPWTVLYAGSKAINCTTQACMQALLTPAAAPTPTQCQQFTNGFSGINTGEPKYGPNGSPPLEFPESSDGTSLEVMEDFDDFTAFVQTGADGLETGIIQLRSFGDIASAVHTTLYQLRSASRLVIDVRGNAFGSVCKAYDLAYLLSSEASEPPRTMLDVRHSPTMNLTVNAEAGEGGTLSGNFASHPLFQLSPDDFVNPATGTRYINTTWMYPGVSVAGRGNLSTPVEPACDYSDSLLFFERCTTATPGGAKKNNIVTTKKGKGWGPLNLAILTDGLCGGACAVFVRLMQEKQWAKTVTIGGTTGQPIQTAAFAGGINTDLQRLYCQWTEAGVVDTYPVVASLVFPLAGQQLHLPVAEFHNVDGTTASDLAPPTGQIHIATPPPLVMGNASPSNLAKASELQSQYGAISAVFLQCQTPGDTLPCALPNSVSHMVCGSNHMWGSCVVATCDDGYVLSGNVCVAEGSEALPCPNPVSAGGGALLWFFGFFFGLICALFGQKCFGRFSVSGLMSYGRQRDVPMSSTFSEPAAPESSMLDNLKSRRTMENKDPLLDDD